MSLKTFTLIVIAIIFANNSFSQGRLKVGGGINYILNDFEQKKHLDNYIAPSVNINYTLLKEAGLSLSIENATSFKVSHVNNNQEQTSGFTSALPAILDYRVNKTGLYIGAGPAYFKQVSKNYSYNEKVSEFFLNTLAGVRFKGSPILGDLIYFEYNIRVSYYKSFKNTTGDAGLFSFIIFFRA